MYYDTISFHFLAEVEIVKNYRHEEMLAVIKSGSHDLKDWSVFRKENCLIINEYTNDGLIFLSPDEVVFYPKGIYQKFIGSEVSLSGDMCRTTLRFEVCCLIDYPPLILNPI
jgi:hypothetical protein